LSNYNPQEALKHYRELGLETEVNSASPHRLIQLLFIGALDRLAVARDAIEHKNAMLKEEQIAKVIGIVGGLRASLDMTSPGELPANLDQLYEYMEVRLLEASAANDVTMLDEVVELLRTLKSGWDEIAP
jgi:flagellar protein FliS